MRILVDTNVLLRMAHGRHPHTPLATAALETLLAAGHDLRIVPQVLYEYWSVATRSADHNGLGLAVAVVSADVERFKTTFNVLRDERGVLERWHELAERCQVTSKQTHDARLVAAMQRHGLSHLLTFNGADFQRYPGVELLDPAQLPPLPV